MLLVSFFFPICPKTVSALMFSLETSCVFFFFFLLLFQRMQSRFRFRVCNLIEPNGTPLNTTTWLSPYSDGEIHILETPFFFSFYGLCITIQGLASFFHVRCQSFYASLQTKSWLVITITFKQISSIMPINNQNSINKC